MFQIIEQIESIHTLFWRKCESDVSIVIKNREATIKESHTYEII